MAKSEDAPSQTRRCPRCETTKHRSEITSMGYCRPCARDYGRERAAKKGGWAAIKAKSAAPAPSPDAPVPHEVAEEMITITVPRASAKPTTTIKDLADKVRTPVLVSTERVTLPLDEQTRRRIIARQLANELLAVLNPGEQLTLVATRVGAGVLIDTVQLDAVLL